MDFDSADQPNPFAAPETAPETIPFNTTDLFKVVRSQKLLLYMLLLSIVLTVLLFVGDSLGALTPVLILWPFLGIVAYIGRIVAVAQLSKAVGCPTWLTAFYIGVMCLSFFTFVSLFAFLIMLLVNGQANRLLSSVGVPVGLMGVSRKNQALLPAAQAKLNRTVA